MGLGMPSAISFRLRWISGHVLKYPCDCSPGICFRTSAASMIRSSTMSRVQSAIGLLLTLAIQLVTELPDEFALRPGQPLVVDGDGEYALFMPAVPLHLFELRRSPPKPGGWKRIDFIRPSPAAGRRSR